MLHGVVPQIGFGLFYILHFGIEQDVSFFICALLEVRRTVQGAVLGGELIVYFAMYGVGKHRMALAETENERIKVMVFQ